jgi:hypothetical protein
MNGRNNAARILVTLGAVVFIAAALLHLSAYRKDLGAVSASNLIPVLKGGVRAIYFSDGLECIVIAIIMLISAFSAATKLRKVIVLFGGFAVLAYMAVTLAFMGWFWGIDLYLATALMTICGGLLFQNTAG